MKKSFFLIPMLMAVFLLLSVQAQASFVLVLDDPATPGIDKIIIDEVFAAGGVSSGGNISTGADAFPGVGIVNFTGSLLPGSVWTINITGGISKPVVGSATVATMDLVSQNTSTTGAGTVNIYLTDTDFTLPGQSLGLFLTNEWGGTAQSSVFAQGYLDPSNTELGQPAGSTTGLQGPLGPGAFSDTASAIIPGFAEGQLFSLTEWVQITHTASGVSSFDKKLTATVPEPATMLLSGLGLLGLGVYLRRRSKKA